MSAMTDSATAFLQDQVRILTDRAEIARLCDRYVLHLDQDRDNDDWLGSVFTDDVRMAFPFGTYEGITGLTEFQQMARTAFARTHHISSNYDITLDGDNARVRAHLMAVHVPRIEEPATHFSIGGHYEAQAVRTDAGWRIRGFHFDIVWTAGEGPGGPAHP
jgi:SnoaL-like domain